MDHQTHVCVHGHFYQPPRENPFTGEVEDQPSAAPYRNWNDRITAECYEACTHARILDGQGKDRRELNLYGWISFDFGPTLLSWLEDHAEETYEAILKADGESRERFDGHGSALAHGYNHSILPLANRRDKVTQTRWGIADFVHRFGRRPEGMWLPETAVDQETLEVLSAEGIRYTVLSPYQAASPIDPRIPYKVALSGGNSISVFFYDGPLSQEIAFNGLLEDGRILAKRLLQALGEAADHPLLANVATDGETYGHHHRFGEMALAAAVERLAEDSEVSLTNYGDFLARHPPERTVEIIDCSSWSCAHGVERWRDDCGCSTGRHPDWNQAWRRHLRSALDYLRDQLVPEFERAGGELLADPWAARDDYIEVLLGGSRLDFISRHGKPDLTQEHKDLAFDLLEIQHHAMLMYTSCGWFFDDITGIESVLVLRHAGRVIELARTVLGQELEPGFLGLLEKARSNEPGLTGRDVYETEVRPFMS